jgi:hypothetical protein
MPEMCFQCEKNGKCLLISIARKLFAECINIEKWVVEPVESTPPDVDVCTPCSKRLTPFHPCPDPGCKTNLKKLESPPPNAPPESLHGQDGRPESRYRNRSNPESEASPIPNAVRDGHGTGGDLDDDFDCDVLFNMEDCEHIDCYESCPKRPKGADIPEDIDVPPNSEYTLENTTVTEISEQPEKSCGTCKKYPADFNDDGCEDCGDQEPYDNWKPREDPEKPCGTCHNFEDSETIKETWCKRFDRHAYADGITPHWERCWKPKEPEKSCETCKHCVRNYDPPYIVARCCRIDVGATCPPAGLKWWEPREGD